MAIVRKVKSVPTQQQEEKQVVAPVAKKQPVVKKEEKVVVAPADKKPASGKKVSLIKKAPNKSSFEIKEGAQATQEAFIDIFYKKLIEREIEVTKVLTKDILKAYGETLKEVTDIASYREPVTNIFYARRFIGDRVSAPPRAANGLKTLMKGHYEVKVRKILGNLDEIKYFGEVSEDGTTFIAHVFDEEGNDTGETVEIPLEEVSEKELSKVEKKAPVKKQPVAKKEEIEEEIEEEDYFDEDELDFDDDEE